MDADEVSVPRELLLKVLKQASEDNATVAGEFAVGDADRREHNLRDERIAHLARIAGYDDLAQYDVD